MNLALLLSVASATSSHVIEFFILVSVVDV